MRALWLVALFLVPFVQADGDQGGGKYESFETPMHVWRFDDDVWCLHEPEPCSWKRDGQRSPGAAFDKAWGLVLTQEGIHDSGAVWVEARLPRPLGDRIEVAFWVFSPYMGPPTSWEARGYVGATDPESEFELMRAGTLDDVPGWHRFCVQASVTEGSHVWVAAGVRAAYESGLRVHFLDYVSVRGVTGGEPCGLLDDLCHIASATCVVTRP